MRQKILALLLRIIRSIIAVLRRYFMAGLLAFAPIGITIWAVGWIIEKLDNLLLPMILPLFMDSQGQTPEVPPFLGVIFTILVIIFFGVLARNFLGKQIVAFSEKILSRVPVARSIYGAVKQLFEAIVHSNERDFSRVVLIEYPRRGIYAPAFVTGTSAGVVQKVTPHRMLNCFVPTTPNPTSGFYLLVPEDDVIEINISVEDAFKLVMSAGLVTPPQLKDSSPKENEEENSSQEST